MKLACELPVNYQETLSSATDFDFILTHLVLENKEYREFYAKLRRETLRESILDCSIFELGQALSAEKVIEAAKLVDPSIIISPDVLFDAPQTLLNLEKFLAEYGSLLETRGWKLSAVLQGNTLDEIAQVYQYYCNIPLITCICIPFSTVLKDTPKTYTDFARMISRIRITEFLEEQKLVDTSKKHHLLGVSLPAELLWQRARTWVTSADTSSPIVAGLTGEDPFKKTTKLVRTPDYFELPYYKDRGELLLTKLHEFRKIIE